MSQDFKIGDRVVCLHGTYASLAGKNMDLAGVKGIVTEVGEYGASVRWQPFDESKRCDSSLVNGWGAIPSRLRLLGCEYKVRWSR